jgi:hypothetical protein
MIYTSLLKNEEKKNFFVKWLREQAVILDGKKETSDNQVFETPDGDVINAKDCVGYLLATLTDETVKID